MTAELLGKSVKRTAVFGTNGANRVVRARTGACLGTHARARVRRLGFTLVELMVVVSIASVLVAVGAPALMDIVATQRVKTATFDFYAALSYARSEAIKRNAVVTISPRSGGFVYGYDLQSAGGEVLKSNLGNLAVAVTAPVGVALAFDGYGRLTSPVRYLLELTPTQGSGIAKRCLVISPTGRPSIRVDNNHDGNCING